MEGAKSPQLLPSETVNTQILDEKTLGSRLYRDSNQYLWDRFRQTVMSYRSPVLPHPTGYQGTSG